MSEPETRGILTDGDKEWLRGETEYEHTQSKANRKQEIRERVALAMQDFRFLIDHWSSEEREKTMEAIDAEQCAKDMVEFLYLALNEWAANPKQIIDEGGAERGLAFRRALCDGIRDAKDEFGEVPDTVLIDSNTHLYELPSEDEIQRALDTDDWRDANEYTRNAVTQSDDAVIDKSEAAQDQYISLKEDIENELYHRRHKSDSDLIRHEKFMGSSGL